ncbi:hypothetical protein RUND412_008714 [Rhizina undulata]
MRLSHFLPLLSSLPLTYTIPPPLAPYTGSLTTWMSRLSSETCIQTLSIPGSHDTIAFEPSLFTYSRTQTLPLLAQLHAGIRFLDIRARHYQNTFTLHHGRSYLGHTFPYVVHTLHEFITGAGRDETMIMRLKDEDWKSEGNTRSFQQTFEDYIFMNPDTRVELQEILYFPPFGKEFSWPELGKVRGKVVVILDYIWDSETDFIIGPWWFDGRFVIMQDRWKVLGSGKKVGMFKNFWKETIPYYAQRLSSFLSKFSLPSFLAGGPEDGGLTRIEKFAREMEIEKDRKKVCAEIPLLVNFASFSDPLPPVSGSRRMYPKLGPAVTEWWDKEGLGKGVMGMGVVVWDYVSEQLAAHIVSRNFEGDDIG